jgi:hypothetical protein
MMPHAVLMVHSFPFRHLYSGTLDNFTPATPVFLEVQGVSQIQPRFQLRRQSKEHTYCASFRVYASAQGYKCEIRRERFVVNRDGDTLHSYQCAGDHEHVLRAYKALVMYCGGDLAQFMLFAADGITEARVPVLPLTPDGSVSML